MRKLALSLATALVVAQVTALGMTMGAPAASAEVNPPAGTSLKPVLGWSSWSFYRKTTDAADVEAQAAAMKSSGLEGVGYQYINLDDFWYQCPGSQGPNVDNYGRWVTDATRFPSGANAEDGIQVVADYVHHLGLKFGIYATPGISDQAVAQNTLIEGTSYTADDIATTTKQNNYNCRGMTGIDYTQPGAQAYVNSIVDQYASWGVDYIKLDGITDDNTADIQAWSAAIRQSGRPMQLDITEGDYTTAIAPAIDQYATQYEYSPDVEEGGSATGGLTDYASVAIRFDTLELWQPYGGSKVDAYDDFDSVEVGNGNDPATATNPFGSVSYPDGDGLTPDERQTQLSLWALGSSPLILGTDLTHLNPLDLSYLKNRAVLAVDQDAIDASRIVNGTSDQVIAKTEKNGDVVVGLFNTTTQPETISTTASAIGLPAGRGYLVRNLWTKATTESGSTISASVPAHGVALLRIVPTKLPELAPPSTTVALGGLSAPVNGGQSVTATATFTDNGVQPVSDVRLSLSAPKGWTVKPTSATSFASVGSGATRQATFQLTAGSPGAPLGSASVTATADYRWDVLFSQQDSTTTAVSTVSPVQAPYQTYSSATDAPAEFGQYGQQFAIQGAGSNLNSSNDAYSAIYQPGAAGSSSTIETEVVSQQHMAGSAKAGIIVRNSMTGSGTTPEGVALYASPSAGIELGWDNNSGNFINSTTPASTTYPESLPVWLKLVRDGSTYTGFYSTDGSTWTQVGTENVPGQAASQDAGMFVNSHASGTPGLVDFQGFSTQ